MPGVMVICGMLNSRTDRKVTKLIMHLRDQHGLEIVGCERCEGTGCPGCHFQGILGVDFEAGRDHPRGPDFPPNDLFRGPGEWCSVFWGGGDAEGEPHCPRPPP